MMCPRSTLAINDDDGLLSFGGGVGMSLQYHGNALATSGARSDHANVSVLADQSVGLNIELINIHLVARK